MNKTVKRNLWLVAGILALALALWLWQAHKPAGAYAVLTYTGGEMKIPLDKNATYDVKSGEYTVHLQVEDGKIRFVDSPCPDHVCEGFGWLQNEDDWAACVPAQAALRVEDASG